MSREVELGWTSWTSFTWSCPSCSSTAVHRTLSLWLCPAQPLKQQLRSAQVPWTMARGHRLNTSILLAAVHGLSGLFSGGFRGRAFNLSSPSHSVPVPNNPSRFRGLKEAMKKKNGLEFSRLVTLWRSLGCCRSKNNESHAESGPAMHAYRSLHVENYVEVNGACHCACTDGIAPSKIST